VRLRDGKCVFRREEEKFNAMTFLSFLKQLRSVSSLEFLPPYSPELNPIERLWKLIRRLAIHNEIVAKYIVNFPENYLSKGLSRGLTYCNI
jgi:hypothetical protein